MGFSLCGPLFLLLAARLRNLEQMNTISLQFMSRSKLIYYNALHVV